MSKNIEIAGTISFGGKLLNVYGDLDAPLFKAKDISHVMLLCQSLSNILLIKPQFIFRNPLPHVTVVLLL